MENKNTSHIEHEDIISKVLVRSGPPAVYQLKPKIENIGTLTKMTLGEKKVNKINKTILLVGETGSGKSTLINALVNYAMGVKWEDDVWFQIVEEERSQTSDVMVYQIFGFEDKPLPYSLTIIDTPGYGDTRGVEHDDIISQRLLDLFRSCYGVHEINAVGLVLKASENRLSDRLTYIFDSVVSLFGKDMEKNIVPLITHSDGRTPKNALKALEDAKIQFAKNQKNQPVHFLFNNCQSEDRTEEADCLKQAYEVTTNGISQFTEFLEGTAPQNLVTTVEVLNERVRLKACIQNLQERVQYIELKHEEIRQTQEALKKHEEEMKNNKDFTVEVDEAYKDKKPISGGGRLFYEGATCCTVCEENCHHPGCSVAWSPESCEVIKNGRCTSCTGKCPVSAHVKEKWIYVIKTRKVKKTLEDVKKKYEENKAESENKSSLLENLEKEMKKLQKDKDQWLEESFNHVVKLEQIALNVNSLSTIVHLDFLIEKMKEKGDTEKVQKLEEMKRPVEEGRQGALSYMCGKVTKAVKGVKKNSSSKYEDIISKVLVHSGPPAVYQLKPKRENIGTLTKMTLGEKKVNKINKTILLVGETGTGKSALINTLVNYAMGVKWEDDVWFQIVEDEKRSQSQSQTSDVMVYQIFGFEDKPLPYSLTIIDTPGYGDTRGIDHDDIISERLLDLFRSHDGVHEINAVGLVLKATENRLSDRLTYIFDSVVSLFGKDMEKNIVALITHSDGRTPKNALKALEDANIKFTKNQKNQPVHFLFDNCQGEDRTGEAFFLKQAYDRTTKGISQFTEFLEKTAPQNLVTTVEVLNERVRLMACIQNLKDRVQYIELKHEEIRQTKETLKKHEEEMKNNKDFTVEVDEAYKDKKPISARRWWGLWLFHEGAVCCTVCEENCHYPCTLAWYPKHCEVMKGGRCTSCTRKCPASDHVKGKWIYVNKTRKVQKTLEDVKKKYEENKSSLLENLKKEMKKLQKDKDQFLEESFDHVVKLKHIALNADSLSIQVHLDFLIEKMKEKGDTEKVQKLEEMKRRVEKGSQGALDYMATKLTKAVKGVKRNSSSKYEDITSKVLVHSGPPAVYQLKPKRENIGTLTKMTLGENNVNKINKTILLVGETGSGKSALINTLVNYAMGVKWEDDVWFQIVEDEKRSQSQSQTSDVMVYQIFGFEDKPLPYSLTIINTPGYGDTRGIEHDDIITQRLLDLFRSHDGVHEINAVGLVLKASENRLSDRLTYIFDSVVSLFGKDMEKNIVALITHSDGRTPKNALKALEDAKIQFAKNQKNQPVHFLFDNNQDEDRTEEADCLKQAYDRTTKGMSQFTEFLEKTAPQNLVTTVEVLNERVRLMACIQNLQDRVQYIELKHEEIRQTKEALKKHEEEMKNNKDFTVEVDEVYKEKKSESSLLNNLEEEMEKLQKDKDHFLEESFNHVVKLQPIAMNADSLSTQVHLDFLIEKMKEKGDTEKVQKLEKMKRRVEEGSQGALRYMSAKLTKAVKGVKKISSSKYEDITSKVLVHSGSPAVYQLKPKKENIGTLTKMTLGEKKVNKTNKTILLVGETGSGKSALINSLVNYAMGVKWEDDVWFQIVEDEKRSPSQSQTSDVMVYQIFGFEDKPLPYSLTIIDTPGYGDTRGIEQDDIISERLLDLFRSHDGVHEINAVGLVLKATENRLSDRLRYIFDSVVSLFGKDMEKNIVALMTHSNGITPKYALKALKDANIKFTKNQKNQPVHFLFNNCQSKDRTDEADFLKQAYEVTTNGISQFTEFLEGTAPQNLVTTVEVLNERVRLKACIQHLQERVQYMELKHEEIRQTQEALKKHEEEMKNNKDFTEEVDEAYKEKIRGGMFLFLFQGATCCTVCEENCHYPGCSVAWSPKSCEVMKGGRCTSCTGKCPVSAHVKEKWIYVTKTRKVQKTLEDVKKKYEENKAESENKSSLLENLKKEIEKLQKDKDQWLEESFHHVVKLEQIALNVNSLSTIVHLDFLIEKMKEKGDTEKVQKLEEMKRRVEEGRQGALRYMCGKVTKAVKGVKK